MGRSTSPTAGDEDGGDDVADADVDAVEDEGEQGEVQVPVPDPVPELGCSEALVGTVRSTSGFPEECIMGLETESGPEGGSPVGSATFCVCCCAIVQVEEDSGVAKDADMGVENEEEEVEEEEDVAGDAENDAAGEEDEEVEEEEEEGVLSCLCGFSSDSEVQEVEEVGSVGERGGEGDIAKSETGLVSVRSGDNALALLILLPMMVDIALLLLLVRGDDGGEDVVPEPDKGTFLIVDGLMVLLLAFLMILLNCATRESVRFWWGSGSWNEDLAVMSDPGELARGDVGVRDGEGETLGEPGDAVDV